jgi:UDP:flavonoid glycosyltransferase YjiC (YdhE family)
MARMLMATWDGAGNFPPERALIRELAGRGHAVSVLGHDTQQAAIEADGAVFIPYDGVTQVDSSMPSLDAETIGRIKPDILLIDELLVMAMAVAHESGLPTVALGGTLHSFLEGTPLQAPNEACQLMLKFSYRAFDPDAHRRANAAYVGPLRPHDDVSEPWKRREPERPLILTSLSSGFQDQKELLQRLCDALGDMQVEALVTTGSSVDPASLTVKGNTTVLRKVPHEAVLGEVDVLITHAGHGTVMAGATFGVPMLCLPMGRDQPLVAQRVAALGLGVMLDPGATVEQLQAAISDLLSDKSTRQRSRAFADQVAGNTRAGYAAELVEGLLLAR